MYYVGSFFDHINEGTQCNSAVPKIFEQGGGGQCWYSFSYFWGGRDDTYKSVIVTLSDLWGGATVPSLNMALCNG